MGNLPAHVRDKAAVEVGQDGERPGEERHGEERRGRARHGQSNRRKE